MPRSGRPRPQRAVKHDLREAMPFLSIDKACDKARDKDLKFLFAEPIPFLHRLLAGDTVSDNNQRLRLMKRPFSNVCSQTFFCSI